MEYIINYIYFNYLFLIMINLKLQIYNLFFIINKRKFRASKIIFIHPVTKILS